MTDQVTITRADGVLEILWNRPDKKNALSQAMYAKAADALARGVDGQVGAGCAAGFDRRCVHVWQ